MAALGATPAAAAAPVTDAFPPTSVPGGASDRGFFLPPFGCGTSISVSSFGISETLVRNSFSSVCAITTTSSPGLLYT
uniref:Putative secreted protein n=1 Tax=Anopheles triannulatus TaxID=58253 RepID=A0A2M4B1P2_9DIPT